MHYSTRFLTSDATQLHHYATLGHYVEQMATDRKLEGPAIIFVEGQITQDVLDLSRSSSRSIDPDRLSARIKRLDGKSLRSVNGERVRV